MKFVVTVWPVPMYSMFSIKHDHPVSIIFSDSKIELTTPQNFKRVQMVWASHWLAGCECSWSRDYISWWESKTWYSWCLVVCYNREFFTVKLQLGGTQHRFVDDRLLVSSLAPWRIGVPSLDICPANADRFQRRTFLSQCCTLIGTLLSANKKKNKDRLTSCPRACVSESVLRMSYTDCNVQHVANFCNILLWRLSVGQQPIPVNFYSWIANGFTRVALYLVPFCFLFLHIMEKAETNHYTDTSANEDNSLAEIFVSRNVISRRFL